MLFDCGFETPWFRLEKSAHGNSPIPSDLSANSCLR